MRCPQCTWPYPSKKSPEGETDYWHCQECGNHWRSLKTPGDAGKIAGSPLVSDYAVLSTMIQKGGSFVRALGEAGLRADPQNLLKIKNAWPEYWANCYGLAAEALGVKRPPQPQAPAPQTPPDSEPPPAAPENASTPPSPQPEAASPSDSATEC